MKKKISKILVTFLVITSLASYIFLADLQNDISLRAGGDPDVEQQQALPDVEVIKVVVEKALDILIRNY